MNFGSGLGKIDAFTVFQNNELNINFFFDNYEYFTLDYFDLDLDQIKKNGGYKTFPDQQEKKMFVDKKNFTLYPENFHKLHIKHDLNLKFDNKTYFDYFDFIYSEDVIEHIKNPYEFSKTLLNLLKPDGIAVITTPFSYPYHKDPEDYQRFTHEGLKNLFISQNTNLDILLCGYDLTIRRENRLVETNKDFFGYWRENWWTYLAIKKK